MAPRKTRCQEIRVGSCYRSDRYRIIWAEIPQLPVVWRRTFAAADLSTPPLVSALLLVLDVADDVGHVLVAFLLLLDEGRVVHALIVLDLHVLLAALRRLGRLLLATGGLGVGILERDELGLGGLR